MILDLLHIVQIVVSELKLHLHGSLSGDACGKGSIKKQLEQSPSSHSYTYHFLCSVRPLKTLVLYNYKEMFDSTLDIIVSN